MATQNSDNNIEIPDTLIDVKGDLIVGSADDTPARLGVGADGTVLTAASGQATGLAWAGIADGWISAAESWSYASATTITVPTDATTKYQAGMRIKLTQTTIKYFIITNVAATVLTVYGGTDYTLANAAISANSYSTVKAPFGFPLNPAKWTVRVTDTASREQASPTTNVWYNLGGAVSQITIPVGAWKVRYQVNVQSNTAAAKTVVGFLTTLSTANNSASDAEFNAYTVMLVASGTLALGAMHVREKTLMLATATTYYLNTTTASASTLIYNNNGFGTMVIEAICAYL